MKSIYLFFGFTLASFLALSSAFSQTGYPLEPVSGADGVFEIVILGEDTVYRASPQFEAYYPYMYFRTGQEVDSQTVYVEVTYLDIGYNHFGMEYNSVNEDYWNVQTRYNTFVIGSGHKKTAVFELPDARFRGGQNLNADLRLYVEDTLRLHIISAMLYYEPTPLFRELAEGWMVPYAGPVYSGNHPVDADSLKGKVICGYQGWFRAAGDPANRGWVHYVHGDFTDLTVEMWPDMLEYTDQEKYPVPGWKHADGSQAYLLSSANKRTVLRHFQWMEAYGIDGVAVQRFIFPWHRYNPTESFRIPSYAREAAARTGRVFYIMYDMSGCDTTALIEALTIDWRFLVDSLKITRDDQYLHHGGKPVVGIFGFFTDRFSAAIADSVLDIFQDEGPYEAFVAASGQWPEPEEHLTGWLEVQKRYDAYIPWNVGNYHGDYAQTEQWTGDRDRFEAHGVLYMPLIYPGFGWDNLMNQSPGTTYKSRLKGDFMWQQFLDAEHLGAKAVYVAMFDEIDESTAIFKVTNDVPINHYFSDLEGLNSDFYLLLTGYGTRMMRGEEPVPLDMPDFDSQSQPPVPDIISPAYGDTVARTFQLTWSRVNHLSGITGYEIEIDSLVVSDTATSRELDLENGIHTFRVRAVNGLNNQGGWSERLQIWVDNALSDERQQVLNQDGSFQIHCYPNPFQTATTIYLAIPEKGQVTLEIFSISGGKVATPLRSILEPGSHRLHFAATGLPQGIYFCRLRAGNNAEVSKMIILR